MLTTSFAIILSDDEPKQPVAPAANDSDEDLKALSVAQPSKGTLSEIILCLN